MRVDHFAAGHAEDLRGPPGGRRVYVVADTRFRLRQMRVLARGPLKRLDCGALSLARMALFDHRAQAELRNSTARLRRSFRPRPRGLFGKACKSVFPGTLTQQL